MVWLRRVLPWGSVERVRVRNFERCVEESPGVRLIDERRTGGGVELTVRLAPDSAMSDDLVRLLNTGHVVVTGLSTEREAAYLTVRIS